MPRCSRSTAWSSARPRHKASCACRRIVGPGTGPHSRVLNFSISRTRMRLTQSLFSLAAAAPALAVGSAYAEDKIGKDENDPGFNKLDKNNDGYLSRSEAAGNPTLSK